MRPQGTKREKFGSAPAPHSLTTNRQFCRFASPEPGLESSGVYTTSFPEGGLCLSSFLILTEGDSPRVLMGHLNPAARWDEIGALDSERARVHSKGWMLPSSHLMVFESPQEAAHRILREQLGIQQLDLSGPKVVSEVGTPKRFPTLKWHWDLEFIFRGTLAEGPPKYEAWSELQFVDLSRTGRQEIARSHDEVLESAGFNLVS